MPVEEESKGEHDSPFFTVRTTIWELIEAQVRPSECEEIRRIVGNSYIEDNQDLQREVESLYEILLDYQKEVAEFRESLATRKPRLPAAPARELLEQQISLLLDHLNSHSTYSIKQSERCKGTIRERDNSVGNKLPDNGPNNQVLEYITRKRQSCTSNTLQVSSNTTTPRPASSYSMCRPMSARSTTSSCRNSTISAPEAVLEPLRENLNVFKVDECVDVIRSAIIEEKELLLEDVEYLQSCLEMEHEEISEEKLSLEQLPPSMDELRKYSQQLEQELLQSERETQRDQVLFNTPSPKRASRQQGIHNAAPVLGFHRATRLTSTVATNEVKGVKPHPPKRRNDCVGSNLFDNSVHATFRSNDSHEHMSARKSSALRIRSVVQQYRSIDSASNDN